MFKGREWHVAPNHIVIPSPHEGSGCPFGPPFPASRYAVAPASNGGDSPNITLIDSGYQDWWGDNTVTVKYRKQHKSSIFGKWGDNPLESVCDLVQVKETPWLQGTGHRLTPTDVIHAVGNEVVAPFQAVPGWNTTPSPLGDVPAANKQDLLDAIGRPRELRRRRDRAGMRLPDDRYLEPQQRVPGPLGFLVRERGSAVSFDRSQPGSVAQHAFEAGGRDPRRIRTSASGRQVGARSPASRTSSPASGRRRSSRCSAICTSREATLVPMIVAPAGNEGSTSPLLPGRVGNVLHESSNREAYKAQRIPSDLLRKRDRRRLAGPEGERSRSPTTDTSLTQLPLRRIELQQLRRLGHVLGDRRERPFGLHAATIRCGGKRTR